MSKSPKHKKTKRINRNKAENVNFNLETYVLADFRLNFSKTNDLVLELVDNLISKIITEYHFSINQSRTYNLIRDFIYNYFSAKIYSEISRDKKFKMNINLLEKMKVKDWSSDNIKELHKTILMYHLGDYFHLVRIFSAIFVAKENQKEIAEKLKIYEKYKPPGKKYLEGRELIYKQIPYTHKRLIQEYNVNDTEKPDIITAVDETIKSLEKKKLIPFKKHKLDKVYDSYLKTNLYKEYRDSIVEKTKKVSKSH